MTSHQTAPAEYTVVGKYPKEPDPIGRELASVLAMASHADWVHVPGAGSVFISHSDRGVLRFGYAVENGKLTISFKSCRCGDASEHQAVVVLHEGAGQRAKEAIVRQTFHRLAASNGYTFLQYEVDNYTAILEDLREEPPTEEMERAWKFFVASRNLSERRASFLRPAFLAGYRFHHTSPIKR